MESNKREKGRKEGNADVKELRFTNLPGGSSQWIVVACGKIVNDRTGSYQQEIVLKKYSQGDKPSLTWNLRDYKKLAFVNVNIGSIRVFAPGTIIQKKRIIKFAHEYLTKIDLVIDAPQSLQKKPFRILYDPVFTDWERMNYVGSIDPIETRILDYPDLGRVMIPCNVIADYYFYGKNTYLTKAILEGNIDSRFAVRNDVYNPKKLIRDVSPTGNVIVRVELQRRMDLRDKFKIARLAHDFYFHDKCLDIYTSMLRGNTEASYIDTDLPIEQPTVLSVYGVQTRVQGNLFFLVHSISKCTAKAPFDLVAATKPFQGKGTWEGLPGGGAGGGEDGLGLGSPPMDPPKPRTRRKLKPDSKTVGTDKPQWDAMAEDISFDNGQTDNFTADAGINERDFLDPKKRGELLKTLIKYGFAPRMSTDPNRKGSEYTLPLNLSAEGPAKPRPAPPTTAFEIIGNMVAFLEAHFKGREYETTSTILCPVKEGIDKYSAFPVSELLKEPDIVKRKKYLFFCFQYIQQKKHTHHRRIFINELVVAGRYFYIMDVEPKYKAQDAVTKVERYVSSSGVIFYAGREEIKHDALMKILMKVVTTFETNLGCWKFLRPNYPLERIQHRSTQKSYQTILNFMVSYLK